MTSSIWIAVGATALGCNAVKVTRLLVPALMTGSADARRATAAPGRGATLSIWIAVGATALGCNAVKLARLLVPAGILERPFARRLTALLPVALPTALTAQRTFGGGHALVPDACTAGLVRPPWRSCGEHPSCWSSRWLWW